jgi:hypothetical protein
MAATLNIIANFCAYTTGYRTKKGREALSSIYSFFGGREMFAAWYQYKDIIEAMKAKETPGQQIIVVLTKLLKILTSAEDTIMMQPKVMQSENHIVNVEYFRMLMATVFEAIEAKEWADGMADAGIAFDPKYFQMQISYVSMGSIEALATFRQWVDFFRAMCGYPAGGPATNSALLEFGNDEDGPAWINCIKQCWCTNDEIDENVLNLKFDNTFKCKTDYWTVEDMNASWQPMSEAYVTRDGRIIAKDQYKIGTVCKVTEVDRWLVSILRTGAFTPPEIVQARRDMGDGSDWVMMLESLGVVDVYLGIGLQPAFAGYYLPWLTPDPAEVDRKKRLKGLPKVADFASREKTDVNKEYKSLLKTIEQITSKGGKA